MIVLLQLIQLDSTVTATWLEGNNFIPVPAAVVS